MAEAFCFVVKMAVMMRVEVEEPDSRYADVPPGIFSEAV